MSHMYLQSDELENLLKEKSIAIIDIRENSEFTQGHIPGAINLPMLSLTSDKVGQYCSSRVPVFHCYSGHRTRQIEPVLESFELKEYYILTDGFKGWLAQGGDVSH